MMQKEQEIPVKLINRELKYQGTILKMYEDQVEVHGHRARWDFIHHDGAAAIVPVDDQGRILMVRQYRHALGRYTLEIPAGKLDSPDEPTLACATRELEEETGYRSDHIEYLISVNTTVAFCDEHIDIYVAHDLIPSHQHLDPDEEIAVEAWSVDDLAELIYAGKITDGKTIAAVMAYGRKYQKKN